MVEMSEVVHGLLIFAAAACSGAAASCRGRKECRARCRVYGVLIGRGGYRDFVVMGGFASISKKRGML